MYVSYSSFHAILIPMNHVKKMISEIDSRCKPKISVFGGVYLDFVLRCCPLYNMIIIIIVCLYFYGDNTEIYLISAIFLQYK